jgi:phytoene desaturase
VLDVHDVLEIEGRYDEVARRIRTERIVTPEGWRDEFGLWMGATCSMKHSLDQMLHLRSHNRFEDVDGIYLTGGGTHRGSGLPVIFQSARISSKLLEDLEIEPRSSTSSELAMRNDRMQVAL